MWFGFSDLSKSHTCRSCKTSDWRLPDYTSDEDSGLPLWRPKKWPKTAQALLIVGSDSCVANSFPDAECEHGDGRFPGHLQSDCNRPDYLATVLRPRYANNIFPRAKLDVVKVLRDPPRDIFNDSLRWLRRAQDRRVIFHYAFQERQTIRGTPNASVSDTQLANGENILLYDLAVRSHVKIPITNVYKFIPDPALFIFDCPNGTQLLEALDERDNASIPGAYLAIARTVIKPRTSSLLSKHSLSSSECAFSTAPTSWAAQQLPTTLLTDCLLDPIQVALRFHLWCTSLSWGEEHLHDLDWVKKGAIPGAANSRNTALGEIVWIFTAIVDAIAWSTFDNETFTLLFRGDSVVAGVFRNYLMAERVLVCIGGHRTITRPALASTARHPLWDTWDHVLGEFLLQVQTENPEDGHTPSPFFARQMRAFAVSLRLGADTERKPMQLPILLQILLHTGCRLECLRLLAAYMDLSPWAVFSATVIGIKPYLVKILLQKDVGIEVKEVLLLLWAKLIVRDPEHQMELLKEDAFNKVLELLSLPQLSGIYKAYVCCILAMLCRHHSRRVCALCIPEKKGIIRQLFELLKDDNAVLQGMVCFFLTEMSLMSSMTETEKASMLPLLVRGIQRQPTDRLLHVLSSANPTVRALATYCVGQLMNRFTQYSIHVPERSVMLRATTCDASLSHRTGKTTPTLNHPHPLDLIEQFGAALVNTFVSGDFISELNPLPLHEFLCVLGSRIREFFQLGDQCPASSPSSTSGAVTPVHVAAPQSSHHSSPLFPCQTPSQKEQVSPVPAMGTPLFAPPASPPLKPALKASSVVQALDRTKTKRDPWRRAAELLASSPDSELSPLVRRILMSSHGAFQQNGEHCPGCKHHLPHFRPGPDGACAHLFLCDGPSCTLHLRSRFSLAPRSIAKGKKPTLRRTGSESALYDILKTCEEQSMHRAPSFVRPHAESLDVTMYMPDSAIETHDSLQGTSSGAAAVITSPALVRSRSTGDGKPFEEVMEKAENDMSPVVPESIMFQHVCELMKSNGAFGQSFFSINENMSPGSDVFSPECTSNCNLSFLLPAAPMSQSFHYDLIEDAANAETERLSTRSRPLSEPSNVSVMDFEFAQIADIPLDGLQLETWHRTHAKAVLHCHSLLSVALIAGKDDWRVVDYGQLATSSVHMLDDDAVRCPWSQPLLHSTKDQCASCGEPQPDITQFLTLNHRSLHNDPHGSVLACARDDGTFHLYRCWGCRECPLRATGRSYQILPRRRKAALRVGYNPHTQRLLAGGRHSDICIWDLGTERLAATLPHNSTHCISALAEAPIRNGNNLVLFGSADGNIQLIDDRGGLAWGAPKNIHKASVMSLWTDENPTYVSSLDENGCLVHLDLRKNGEPVRCPTDVVPPGLVESGPLPFDVSPRVGSFGPDCEFVTSYVCNDVFATLTGNCVNSGVQIGISRQPDERTFTAQLSSHSGAAYAVSLSPFRTQRMACVLLREEKGSRLVVYGKS